MIEVALATTASERQAARDLVLAFNGAGFCQEGSPASVLWRALGSYPADRVEWVIARVDGVIVGASGLVIRPPGFETDLHSLVTAIDPAAYSAELADELVKGLARYAPWPTNGHRWFTIMAADSPALPIVREAYGESLGKCEVELDTPSAGLVRITGSITGLPWLG